jgi:EmrB/QacA subfamily drug resistance transporter
VLLSNSPAILTGTFPAAQRGQVLGLQSTVTYLGLTIGPSLGGWLAGHWGWRSVFYVNVPIGLLALLLSLRFIPRDEGTARTERFDVVGAATLTAGLVALLLGLNQGHAWGWGSPGLLALLAAALLLLVLFVFVERKSASPMLDLTLFRSRVFSFSVASAMLNYVTMASVLFLMPFFLQQGRGLSPIQAGLVLTAQPLVMAVAAPLSGALSDRIGQRVPATLGMVVLAAGVVLLGRLGPQAAVGVVAAMLAVVGLGTGAFISPNSSALMGAAPRHRQGVAAGMLAEARVIGQVLGVGLAGAIYTTIMARQGGGPPSATLFAAIHTSFIVASGLAALGALASAVRGVHKGTAMEGKP